LGWVKDYTLEDLVAFTDIAQSKLASKTGYIFGIYYKNIFVGCINIKWINAEVGECELGYWLSKEYNGLGIMTKVCKFLINYIFTDLKLNKIIANIATENYHSQRLVKKLGFILDKTLKNKECLYSNYLDNYSFILNK
jgi:ribosomal-protein-serine acetyltransferase